MAGPNLPTNIDATYADSTDPSVKLHQQYHDIIHGIINRRDTTAPGTDGAVEVWSNTSSLYVSRLLDSRDARPLIVKATTVTGAWTVNPSTSTVKDYTLTGNTTFSWAVGGWPTGGNNGYLGELLMYLRQDGVGSRTVTWPASAQWVGGTDPVASTAAGALDMAYFVSVDGGATVQGFYFKGIA